MAVRLTVVSLYFGRYSAETLYGIGALFVIGYELSEIIRRYFLKKTQMSRIYSNYRTFGKVTGVDGL